MPSTSVPDGVVVQGPLTAFEIAGPLDFTMVGVLSGLLEPLARQGISILALSTFDTDWILVDSRPHARTPRPPGSARATPSLRPGSPEVAREHHRSRWVSARPASPPDSRRSGAPDLALVVNDGPDHHAAAVFTSNRVEAAPVTWSRQVVRDGRVDAVVLNSGGANACTGAQGFADTHRDRRARRRASSGVSAGDVVVVLDRPHRRAAADAVPARGRRPARPARCAPTAVRTPRSPSRPPTPCTRWPWRSATGGRVGGMAKGAGMLAPALATMLVVVTTDAVVEPG